MSRSAKWTIFGLSSLCAALMIWIVAEPRVEARTVQFPSSSNQGQVAGTRSLPARVSQDGSPTLPRTRESTVQQRIGLNSTPAVSSLGQAVYPTAGQSQTTGLTVTGWPLTPHPLGTNSFASSPEEQKLILTTHQLVEQLRKGDEDTDIDTVKKELRDTLEEHFEIRMERREAELAKLEERLNKLREELSNRRSAKTEIIDLRHQSLVNEAQGLGF